MRGHHFSKENSKVYNQEFLSTVINYVPYSIACGEIAKHIMKCKKEESQNYLANIRGDVEKKLENKDKSDLCIYKIAVDYLTKVETLGYESEKILFDTKNITSSHDLEKSWKEDRFKEMYKTPEISLSSAPRMLTNPNVEQFSVLINVDSHRN
ncbi:hypothetical protein [Wolbachia endosymbiont of Pentidionis agamae]|uniref:hypothetical protein n=1 Tax=Wolbachia endosymbiont of Pentidionis agamae TaxID=3110435 RepID=UPI002FD634C5